MHSPVSPHPASHQAACCLHSWDVSWLIPYLIPSSGVVPSWSWAEGSLTLVVSPSLRHLLGAVAADRLMHVPGAEAPQDEGCKVLW